MPGILQLNAVEYFANETKDDVDNSLVDGLVMKPVDPNKEAGTGNLIQGETFIKPKIEYSYFYRGKEAARWAIEGNAPVQIVSQTNKKVTLKWISNYHGQFVLKHGNDSSKTIVAESLF